jgi:hypothetical protein
MTPWAEFAMLHLYLMWGGDRLVNLVEFASLVGKTVGVSSIATTFGASRFIQIITAIISATIPEGVLEASGANEHLRRHVLDDNSGLFCPTSECAAALAGSVRLQRGG